LNYKFYFNFILKIYIENSVTREEHNNDTNTSSIVIESASRGRGQGGLRGRRRDASTDSDRLSSI
jgi:hypothetical protein